MPGDYTVREMKRNIEYDLKRIRKDYNLDVSPEIGKVLNSFLSYYKNKDEGEVSLYSKFLNVAYGLERYLKRKTEKPVSLERTRRSGTQICKAISEREGGRVREMRNYFEELARKVMFINGHD